MLEELLKKQRQIIQSKFSLETSKEKENIDFLSNKKDKIFVLSECKARNNKKKTLKNSFFPLEFDSKNFLSKKQKMIVNNPYILQSHRQSEEKFELADLQFNELTKKIFYTSLAKIDQKPKLDFDEKALFTTKKSRDARKRPATQLENNREKKLIIRPVSIRKENVPKVERKIDLEKPIETKELALESSKNEENEENSKIIKETNIIDINQEIANYEIEQDQVNELDLIEINLLTLKLDLQTAENNLNKHQTHLIDLKKVLPDEQTNENQEFIKESDESELNEEGELENLNKQKYKEKKHKNNNNNMISLITNKQLIKERIRKGMYIKSEEPTAKFLSSKLTFDEIQIICEEFEKEESERNYELLDHLAVRLKFFERFNDTLRKKILENSILIKKKACETLFIEGDYGDLMYIIVKGSVNIKVRRNYESYAKGNYEVVINSFYDGDHFGDLAMMSSRKKSISRKKLKEHTSKLAVTALTLIDIRSYLKRFYEQKNSQNENYMEESEINENKRKIYKFERMKSHNYFGLKEEKNMIERTKRTATVETTEETLFLALDREKYQRILFPFLQKSLDEKIEVLLQCKLFEEFEPHVLLPMSFYIHEKKLKLGEMLFRKGETIDNFYIVAKGILNLVVNNPKNVLKSFKRGDFIGSKILLPSVIEKKAVANLISDTPLVILYCIDKENFEYLPFDLKNKIRSLANLHDDFDNIDIESAIKDEKKWQAKSEKILKRLVKEKREKESVFY